MNNAVRPVEIPSGNFDLDSFLETLDYQTRMRVVQSLDAPEPTAPQWQVRSSETGLSGSSWQVKALMGTLVGLAYMAALCAWLVSRMVLIFVNYVKEKNAAR